MMTVRQLERDWNANAHGRLIRDLLADRGESSPRLAFDLIGPVPAAAMVMIRLDELGQAHSPLFSRLLRRLLAAQAGDGGWTDPMTTALVLRALLLTNGQGDAIDRGLNYLATLQKDDGLWPAEPIRRMAADPFVSSWILFNLGSNPSFRRAVRYDDALAALELLEPTLSPDARRLWGRVLRRRVLKPLVREEVTIWS